MNLTELQQYVWAQTDTTSVDISPQTIEAYLEEAFTRTMSAENRWPFYEQGWQLSKTPGTTWLDMPSDMNGPSIMSVYPVAGGGKLMQINQEEAENRFSTSVATGGGHPACYSLWANKIQLWPLATDTTQAEYIVRGYRTPLVMFNQSGEVDADPRLHRALAHYAIALAYAQQEDEVLESTYMDRWQKDVEMVRRALMDPAGNRPLVMYGNFPRRTVGLGGTVGPGYQPSAINPQGPPGPEGPRGIAGPPGPPGPKGAGIRGSWWWHADGAPPVEILGQLDHDYYLDTVSGDVWFAVGGAVPTADGYGEGPYGFGPYGGDI